MSMKSKGFTLLELLLVIGITTTMAVVSFQDKMLETEQSQARRLGMELFQYNSAVQNYLAHQSGSANPSSLQGTFTGVNWLKSTSCGGTASKEWLSCNFLSHSGGKTTLGRLGFKTEIKYDPASGLSARTTMDKLSLGINGSMQDRADLAGLAALVASGAYAVSEDGKAVTAQDSTVAYCPDTAGTSPINAVCQSDKGSIVMLSRNLSAADRWLRVDHGNAMQGALEFRTGDPTPASQTDIQAIDSVHRQIRNVARIYNLGNNNSNGESDNLYLGKKYGNAAKTMATLPNNAVVVDADQEVLGKLVVAATISAKGDITTQGNIVADKNITAKGNLDVAGTATINGALQANDSARISKELLVGGETKLAGKLTAQSDVHINGALTTDKRITGSQDLSIATNGYFGGQVTAQNIDAHGSLSSNSLTVRGSGDFNGEVKATRLVDKNNPGYYLDPDGYSNINVVNAGSIGANDINSYGYSSGKYLFPNTVVAAGTWCGSERAGAIARGPSGETLSCQNGTWKGGSAGLGEGQSWQNVAGARGNNVTYTNTTGRTIVAAVTSCNCRWTQIDAFVGGVKIGYSYAGDFGGSSIMSVIVPPGSTYRFYWYNHRGQYAGIDSWVELR
ncbi:polymer-forming cytoskeletal protein [Aeromonas veronii]|uniref:Shufflon system plasmid conjugative transfer pilus tip adhesin PilV n=1 Tax=Aeromonas veronii TaxID=654 RepID=A0A2T4MWU1_AERVE|nr:polymer-forming cytoskeletal protein [Aeromonas veronii]PTH79057.1 hypothetical protein DAA48_21710 [Aeromonas veronii]